MGSIKEDTTALEETTVHDYYLRHLRSTCQLKDDNIYDSLDRNTVKWTNRTDEKCMWWDCASFTSGSNNHVCRSRYALPWHTKVELTISWIRKGSSLCIVNTNNNWQFCYSPFFRSFSFAWFSSFMVICSLQNKAHFACRRRGTCWTSSLH